MLNTAELEELVREQITRSVNENIVDLLDQTEWLNSVEQEIINYAQRRVVAKFSNSEAMEQILKTVESSVKVLFENGSISNLKDLVDPKDIQRVVNAELNSSIQQHVEMLFKSTEWIQEVKNQVIANFVRSLNKEVQSINIQDSIKDQVTNLFNEYVNTISGISDKAQQTELTVMDGVVVVENELAATNITAVDSISTNIATVNGDLIVKGGVNTNGKAWDSLKTSIQEQVYNKFLQAAEGTLVESILLRASESGINFKEVLIEQQPLVRENKLNSSITHSNIQQLGFLDEISVRGEADFNDTAFVAKKRVGINTREPSSALSVWDEEIEIAIGKRKERTGFIGTNRKQHLEIGVNGKGNIIIKDDGLVVIDQLQVGKQRISHGSDVPGYSASKGDIVFNINVGPKNPVFAWMCVGGFNWVALSASIS